MSFEIVITGFKTKKQAEAFIHWYEGQGEQDSSVWFEDEKIRGNINVTTMNVDCSKTYPLIWNDNTTTMVVQPL